LLHKRWSQRWHSDLCTGVWPFRSARRSATGRTRTCAAAAPSRIWLAASSHARRGELTAPTVATAVISGRAPGRH